MSGEPVIEVRGLRHEIDGRVVLAVPEWRLAPGRHCLVLGPSGSGKTTLINILAGLLRPTLGMVAVGGRELGQMSAAERDALRGRQIGIVFQTLHLIGALSVLDNLRLARGLAGLPTENASLLALLEELGLTALARRRPRALSFGEAQRVAIARAVVNVPTLILADEPTSALDDANCARVLELLLRRAEAARASLVVATHDRRVAERFEARLELAAGGQE